MKARTNQLLLLFFSLPGMACASIGLVAGEPFGSFGTMLPTGHAAIYLDHICAATPTTLRPCMPGEQGVIVSRYHDLHTANIDWLATPVLPFLYGVEDISNIPTYVTPTLEGTLRENYRQAHLRRDAPDRVGSNGSALPPKYGDWNEAIGATFDRRVFLYVIDTTPAQDAAIISLLNSQPNHRRYTFRRRNCADFAADMLNVVVPGLVHRNVLGDFDIMTPKQIARSLDTYGHAHPELDLRVYDIPQLAGSFRRSRTIRGASEGIVKTKRYLFILAVIQPEALFADWVDYEKKDKWTVGLDAEKLVPGDWLVNSPSTASATRPSPPLPELPPTESAGAQSSTN